MRAVDLIAAKRDGRPLTATELRFLVEGYVAGRVGDDQMAAWLMAVVWRGLDDAEVDALCAAMVASGDVVDLSPLGRTVVDKHSTGGVGDKVTLALAPLVAACGVPVAKMSGRGLGHTGGTLDKLEAIPGYRIDMTIPAFVEQVDRVGCAVVAQTDRLVPADRLLYALRDATATVPEPGLIATSVMSKKLAAGAGAIVLDVKVGQGAFVRTADEGRRLATLMHGIGTRAGRRMVCELTRMDAPLGRAVGNALEVDEAFAVLRGEGPADLAELVRGSAIELIVLAGADDRAGAAGRVDAALSGGDAVATAEAWIAAQGGDARVVTDPWGVLEAAPVRLDVGAPAAGTVERADALAIGLAAVRLGAGRARKGDPVDHAVGIVLQRKPGETVERGSALATVHARDAGAAAETAAAVLAAVSVVDGPVPQQELVIDSIR